MAANSFDYEGKGHSEGMPRSFRCPTRVVEAVPLSHFQVVVRNEFNLIPNSSGFLTYGFPTHVDLHVFCEARQNPGNPTDSNRLMFTIRSDQPKNGPEESLMIDVTLPSAPARQLAAALISGADWLDNPVDDSVDNEL